MKDSLLIFISVISLSAYAAKFDCSPKYCKEMKSCAEAKYKLQQCGMDELDRDGDGVPCENVCGKKRR